MAIATFVTLGDSITFGTGATNDYGWNQRVRDSLRVGDSPDCVLYNYGTGSEMASGGETHLATLLATFPAIDLFTVAYGMNDMPPDPQMSTTDFSASLTNIVATMKPRCTRVLMLNITPNTISVPDTATYNAVIAAVATAQSVSLINVNALPIQTLDGVHPNDAGHALMAGLIIGKITAASHTAATGRTAAATRTAATGRT